MKKESDFSKWEEEINQDFVVAFPWKRLIIFVGITLLIGVSFYFFKEYFKNYYFNLTDLLNNLNLPFDINSNLLIFILVALAVFIFWLIIFSIKKIKERHSLGKDYSNRGLKKLHDEEEHLKKKLHDIRKKSFELAKISKEKKAREHYDKLKGTSEIPIESKKDIRKVLETVDELLGKLPEKEIKKFSKTKEAKTYKEILKEYGVE